MSLDHKIQRLIKEGLINECWSGGVEKISLSTGPMDVWLKGGVKISYEQYLANLKDLLLFDCNAAIAYDIDPFPYLE